MKKAETLAAWRAMEPDKPILPHFLPLPYKSSGSTYGSCGIRIDGTPAFVDAVLSHLKELVDGENHVTRLGLNRAVVDGSGIGKELPNAVGKSEVCYIRLHLRGEEGAMASSFFDRHLAEPTKRFAQAHGESY